MPSDTHALHPFEIEIKLALSAEDRSRLEHQLAVVPALAHCKPNQQHLHNVYYDTEGQILRQKRVALRVRRMGSDSRPQWLQTLKISGRNDSALSRRGEWEVELPRAELDLHLLGATPWSDMDPDGDLFRVLAPCFVTDFDRTSWMIHQRDGGMIEVSLDIGQVIVGDLKAPICELELELKVGEPDALFKLALKIARTLSVLPLNTSKSERGYTLAQNTLNAPVRARPPSLDADGSLAAVAQQVLREMFYQFTANLHILRTSEDPEVVHQTRVGWRRFKSGLRLFRKVLPLDAAVSLQALQSLLVGLGALRNLDVARVETLPPLAKAYTGDTPWRQNHWQAMEVALTLAADRQRTSVRDVMADPRLGRTLLAITQWLEVPSTATSSHQAGAKPQKAPSQWAKHQIIRLHDRSKHALSDSSDPISQHRARILAKRLRYSIEALQPLLPKPRVQRWLQQAKDLQTAIGKQRDRHQALEIVSHLQVDSGLCEFLRGVVAAEN